MASLFIKDHETAALVERLAKRSGLTKTALVRELAAEREARLNREDSRAGARERLDALFREPVFVALAGKTVDKAFFDEMWGEDQD